MDYSSHTYPRELAEKIISEWPEVTNPLDDLPPKEALVSLLSEAFQASLLREEGRPIRCRLVLVNPLELSEAEGRPTGMQLLQLPAVWTFREVKPGEVLDFSLGKSFLFFCWPRKFVRCN